MCVYVRLRVCVCAGVEEGTSSGPEEGGLALPWRDFRSSGSSTGCGSLSTSGTLWKIVGEGRHLETLRARVLPGGPLPLLSVLPDATPPVKGST